MLLFVRVPVPVPLPVRVRVRVLPFIRYYDASADMFSLGVVVGETVLARLPCAGHELVPNPAPSSCTLVAAPDGRLALCPLPLQRLYTMSGTVVVLWYCGTVVLWYCGAVVLWCCGAVVL